MASTLKTTSEYIRTQILDAALRHVPFEGWSEKTLQMAVKDCGLPMGAEELYFPGGPIELITFWSSEINHCVEAKLSGMNLSEMKIRDKVTQGVLLGLEALGHHEEAARRAVSRLALPSAFGVAPKILWSGADTIWRSIGDTSTDGNYYSKRAILSGVIGSSLLSWLSDDTDGKSKARAFLDARIANVMSFEKTKWEFNKRRETWPNPAEILGKVRYGRRRRRRSR